MAVSIRPMTHLEFEQFYRWSLENQAMERMEESLLPPDKALEEAAGELAQLLSDGMNTPNHHCMTIIDDTGESVGFIWTLQEEFQGKKQSFLCDIAIWESQRRKGYATAALQMAEKAAAKAGCCESVLFVKDTNVAARALYEKSGYRVLRQKDYGIFMVKPIL